MLSQTFLFIIFIYFPNSLIASEQITEKTLLKHLELCQSSGADSCYIQSKGKIVQDWYSTNYTGSTPMMSSTKGISALLVGMLNVFPSKLLIVIRTQSKPKNNTISYDRKAFFIFKELLMRL